MILGFIGTRRWLTLEQLDSLKQALLVRRVEVAHHGVCGKGDEQFLELCHRLHIYTVVHLSDETSDQTFCETVKESGTSKLLSPKPSLACDWDIVAASEELLAGPAGKEEACSRTWAAIRYAQRKGRKIVVFWPSGAMFVMSGHATFPGPTDSHSSGETDVDRAAAD